MAKKITFNIEGLMDLNAKGMISSLNAIKKNMSNLSGGDVDKLDKLLDKATQQIKDFEMASVRTFKDTKEIKTANRAYENLAKTLQEVQYIMSSGDFSAGSQKIRLALAAGEAELKKIEKTSQEFARSMQQAFDQFKGQHNISLTADDLIEASQNLENIGRMVGVLTRSSNALKVDTSELEAARKELESLIDEQSKAKQREVQARQERDALAPTKKGEKSSPEHGKAIEMVNRAENATRDYTSQIRQQREEIEKLEKAQKAQLKDIDAQKIKNAEIIEQLKTLSAEYIQMQESVDLSKIFGDGFDGLLANLPNTADGVRQAIDRISQSSESIKTEAFQNMEEYLGKITVESEKAEKGLEGITREATELTEMEQKMSSLQNSMLQFFSITSGWRMLQRAMREAHQTVKELDASMTEIAVVSEYTLDQIWAMRQGYSEAATEMGAKTLDLIEATKLYVQQGEDLAGAQEIGIETIKMARIASLDGAEATNLMTAAIRGFKMELQEANRVNDVYSVLAAKSAADTREIAIAMSKTASIAKSSGSEFESMSAFLTQIIETTREAPETAGTAMKTIIARFQELKKPFDEIGEVDGEIVDANAIETALKSAGVALRDINGEFRDFDDVIFELSGKWDTLDLMTQRYIATMAAGSRQQSRFIALVSNHERLMELTGYATNSAGASTEQFTKTQESLEAKMNRLSNAMELFYTSLADSTVIKGAIDLLTIFMNTINKIIEVFSSAPGVIGRVGGVFATLMLTIGGFTGAKRTIEKFFGFVGKSLTSFENDVDGAGRSVAKNFTKPIEKEAVKIPKLFAGIIKDIELTGKTKGLDKALLGDYEQSFRRLQNEIDALSKQPWSDNILKQYTKLEVQKESLIGQSQSLRKMFEREFSPTQLSLMSRYTAEQLLQSQGEERALLLKKTKTSLEAQENALRTNSIRGLLIKIGLVEKENFAQAKGNVITATQIGLKKTLEKLTWANVKSTLALNSAMLLGLGKIALVVGVAVVAFKGLKYVIDKIQANTLDSRMKAAAEETGRAGEAAEKASEAYNDLLGNISRYDELQGGLEELTEGTREWRDALVEANDQVLELLKTYPMLAQYIERGEDGRLSIKEEGFTDLGNVTRQRKEAAQQYDIYSQMAQLELQLEAAEKAFVDSVTSSFASSEVLHKLRDAWAVDPTLFEKDKDGTYKALESLLEMSGFTAENVNLLRETLSAYNSEVQTTELKMANLKDVLLGLSETTGPTANSVKAAISSGLTPDKIDQRADSIKDKIGTKRSLKQDSTYFKEIAEFYGVRDQMVGNIQDQIETLYLAATSFEEIPEHLKSDAEGMLREIAKRSALADIANIESEMTRQIESLSKTSSKDAKAIAGLLSDGGTQLTQNILDGFMRDGEIAIDEVRANIPIYARKLGYEGEDAAEKWAEDLGRTVDELTQYFVDNLTSSLSRGKENEAFLSKAGLTGFKNLIGDLDSGVYDGFISKLQELYGSGGQLDDVLRSATAVFSGISDKLRAELVKGIADTDIKSLNELKQLKETMKKIAPTIETEAIDKLVDDIARANQAIYSFDATELAEKITGAGKALTNIRNKEAGDYGFNEEDYESIVGMFPEMAADFVQDLDGNYTYIGESMRSLEEAIRDDIALRLQEYQRQLENELKTAELIGENELYREELARSRELDREEQVAFIESLKTLLMGQGVDMGQLGVSGLTNDTVIDNLEDQKILEIFDRLLDLANRQDEISSQLENVQNQRITHDYSENSAGSLTRGMFTRDQNQQVEGDTKEIEAMSRALEAQARKAGVAETAMKKYNQAMEEGDTATKAAAASQLAFEIDLEKVAKQLDELDDKASDHVVALKDIDEGTLAYSQRLQELTNDFNNIMDLDLSEDFFAVEENLENLELALEGNQEAWENLMIAIDQAQVESATFAEQFGLDADHIMNINAALDSLEFSIDGEADMTQVVEELMRVGKTTEEVAQFLEALGYTNIEFGVDTKTINIALPGEPPQNIQVPSKVKATKVQIPAARKGSAFGSGGAKSGSLAPSKKAPSKKAPRSKKSGGAGKTAKAAKEEKEDDPWMNDYDWLYNLVQKTNKAIRDRNRLEQDYNRLLKARVTTADDLYENMEMQVRNLEHQGALLEEQRKKRLREKSKITSEYSDVQQYASYNESIGYVEINWDRLERLSGTSGNNEEAERVDQYIKELERISDTINDIDGSLYDIEDKIDSILELGKEEYLSLENRIFDAVRGAQQELINEMSAINDSINNANQKILSKLQEDITDRRRERENLRTEEDIATKEARLAFLRQDTSGAHQLEIMRLEEELAQARQDYTDKLIDDKITELQQQNDAAAEQRQLQIELAQTQLEVAEQHGLLWEEVRRLTAEGVDVSGTLLKDSELAGLLQKQEGFKGMSDIQRMEWTSELEKQVALAATYIRANDKTLDSIFKTLKPTTIAKEPAKSTTTTGSGGSKGGGSGSSTQKTGSSYYPKTTPAQVRAKGLDPNSLVDSLKAAGINSSGANRVKIAKANGIPGYKVTPYNAAHNTKLLKLLNQGKLKRYKKGGLIDFTGPAWVDGSKTDPESILSARDTQNLIALRDTLEGLRRSQGGGDVHGDNYFDIKVHVDSIANDYDVDDLTKRIKKQIYDDASYRNVQVVRGLR